MGITMLAPDIKEYDPHPAIHYWNSVSIRARRPYLKDHIKTKVQTLELHTPPITASGDCDVVVTSEDSANSDVLEGSSLEIPQAEVSAAQEYDKYYDSESDTDYLFVCLFCCFTSQVNSYGHCGTVSSPNHTFSWPGLNKRLTSNSCTYFRL